MISALIEALIGSISLSTGLHTKRLMLTYFTCSSMSGFE